MTRLNLAVKISLPYTLYPFHSVPVFVLLDKTGPSLLETIAGTIASDAL